MESDREQTRIEVGTGVVRVRFGLDPTNYCVFDIFQKRFPAPKGRVAAERSEAVGWLKGRVMRAWAANPGSEKLTMALPDRLVARRKACTDAAESAATAASARKALMDELEAAQASLAAAERSVNQAVLPILLAEAERVAAFLEASKQRTWALTNVLRGFTELWVPTGADGTPRPVPVSPLVVAALDLQEPQCVPSMRPEAKQAAVWRAFCTALLTDPEKTWEKQTS
jgi:hypothetical protein